jgi:hypothetical protein
MIELILVILAWRRGWGPIVLIPFGLSLVLQLLLIAGHAGAGVLFVVGLIDMIILGILCAYSREQDDGTPPRAARYGDYR